MRLPRSDRQRLDRRTAFLRLSAFIGSAVLVVLVWPRQTTSPPSFRDILLITTDGPAPPGDRAGANGLRLAVRETTVPLIDPAGWRELERRGYRASSLRPAGEALLAVERWLRAEDQATPRKPLFLWLDLGNPAEPSTAVEGALGVWRRQRPGWEPVTAVVYQNDDAPVLDIRAPQEQRWTATESSIHPSQLVPSLLAVAGAGRGDLPLRRR